MRLFRERPVLPVTDEERTRHEGMSLRDILINNLIEHVSGSHSWRCRGGCVERVCVRWTAAGWE